MDSPYYWARRVGNYTRRVGCGGRRHQSPKHLPKAKRELTEPRWQRLTRAEIHMARLTRAEFCARAPKVELHVHLDGAFDSAYLFECATKYVEDLPATVDLLGGKSVRLQEAVRSTASPQAFLERFVHLPPTTAKLTDFLAPFPLSMAIVKAAVRAVGLEAIEEFAYRFAQRQHASNALYTEVRYCPHLFLEDAQLGDAAVRLAAAEEVVRAVGRGLHRGEQQLANPNPNPNPNPNAKPEP